MKNLFLLLLATVSCISTSNAIRCYVCNDASSNEECMKKTEKCSWGVLGCENVIRMENDRLRITKRCQQFSACHASSTQNFRNCQPKTILRASLDPTAVIPKSMQPSVCIACCKHDLCNDVAFMEEDKSLPAYPSASGKHMSMTPPVRDVDVTELSPTSYLITFIDVSPKPGQSYYVTLNPAKGIKLTALKVIGGRIPGISFNKPLPSNVVAYLARDISGGTTYDVNIIKKVGFSRYSQGIFERFTTKPRRLWSLKVSDTDTDAVTFQVGWPQVFNYDVYDSIRMSYRKVNAPFNETVYVPPFKRPGRHVIDELESATEYFFQAWTSVDTDLGRSVVESEKINITVKTAVPGVSQLELVEHHATSLTWLIKIPENVREGGQEKFRVLVRDDTAEDIVADVMIPNNQRNFTVEGLTPENYYTMTVNAMNGEDSSVKLQSEPVRTVGRCYACLNAENKEECNQIIECMPSDRGCFVELRTRHVTNTRNFLKQFRATMRCKQVTACDNNEDQNLRHQCDPDNRRMNVDPPEVCRCCCEGDLCNGPGSTCGKLLGWLDPLRDPENPLFEPAVTCPELDVPRTGTIECSRGPDSRSNRGMKCTFKCNKGYHLFGIKEVECLDGGKWTHPVPECLKNKPCHEIKPQIGMHTKCTRGSNPNSVCELTCRPGYELLPQSPKITCGKDGVWSEEPNSMFICAENDECLPNPCVNNARCQDKVNGFKCHCEPGNYGEYCERTRTCIELKKPKNGDIECTDGSAVGSRCRFSCNEGYSQHGPTYTRCTDQGSWSGGEDSTLCIINSCPVPPLSLVNGGQTDCSGFDVGDKCEFFCPTGLRPAGGADTITCKSNSKWSAEVPCCDLPCPPYTKVDVLFVLDSSSSVGRKSWKELTSFTVALLDNFVIGPEDMRVGVLRYNRKVDIKNEILMGDYKSPADLKKKIKKIPYNGYGTLTGQALWHAYNNSLMVPGNRADVPDVIIVITDGLAQDGVQPPSDHLKANGVKMYVVGVINKRDKVNIKQLRKIASGPEYLKIITDGYAALATQLTSTLTRDVCWMPCKFRYEQKEIIERKRMAEHQKEEEEDAEYWANLDTKVFGGAAEEAVDIGLEAMVDDTEPQIGKEEEVPIEEPEIEMIPRPLEENAFEEVPNEDTSDVKKNN